LEVGRCRRRVKTDGARSHGQVPQTSSQRALLGKREKKGPESDYPDVVQKSFDVLPENFPVGRAIIVTGRVRYQFTPVRCLIECLAVGIGDDGIILAMDDQNGFLINLNGREIIKGIPHQKSRRQIF